MSADFNPDRLIPWLAALGLLSERMYKMYSDRKGIGKEIRIASLTEGDSLFHRATEMMDRLEEEAKVCREEAAALRARVIGLQEELVRLRCLLRENGIVVPPSDLVLDQTHSRMKAEVVE